MKLGQKYPLVQKLGQKFIHVYKLGSKSHAMKNNYTVSHEDTQPTNNHYSPLEKYKRN